jgi:hypothetical protein
MQPGDGAALPAAAASVRHPFAVAVGGFRLDEDRAYTQGMVSPSREKEKSKWVLFLILCLRNVLLVEGICEDGYDCD